MTSLSNEKVQLLLDQPRGRGMVVSCYTDMRVVAGFEPHWLQPFKTEASVLRESLEDDHQARQELERDIEAIQRALEAPEARQARGMAVFSAAERGLFLAFPSDIPFANRLVVDDEPYVVPLLEGYVQQQGYLAVLTDTHRGRIYAAGIGGLRLLDEFDEEVPRKNRSAGERWGKQQATIARHREDCILHYHKELAARVKQRWDEYPYNGIVLLGADDPLSAFRALLSERLQARVVDQAPHAWTVEQSDIEVEVRSVIERAAVARQREALDEFAGRIKEKCAVAAGPREVIEALRNGQVSELILEPDSGAIASRCLGCHSLFAEERLACPYCDTACSRCNLWQHLLAMALGHGVRVQFVPTPSDLSQHGGIGALLLRDEPQWAPASVDHSGREVQA